ncbi:AAA family ATPase [Leucobacter chromiireducens]|uniref:AAA family ATPase n=1 Tax=Leucobacter chromiireducens TaxID=283877 RepID=UPI001F15121D|nr:AAA family ATPase [Leucobacter chromiireducens]
MASAPHAPVRVVISGTHGSGKSTLIAAFAAAHPEWEILPDPYEVLDGAEDIPGAATFFAQLQLAAARLAEPGTAPVLAERGPIDFLAYLIALEELGRPGGSSAMVERGRQLVAGAAARVDLQVILPLHWDDAIQLDEAEDLELRGAMNDALCELGDDPDLMGTCEVAEIVGSQEERLAELERLVRGLET